MSPTTDTTVTPRRMSLPPDAADRAALAGPIEEYDRNADAHRQAVAELRNAEGRLAVQSSQARKELADAAVGGKEDAPAENRGRADAAAEVDAAKEKVLALHESTDAAARKVAAAFNADRDDWREQITKDRAKADDKLRKKLEEAAGLVASIEALTGTMRYLHPDLDGKRGIGMVKPPHYSQRPSPGSHGEPAGALVGALLDWVDQPYSGEGESFNRSVTG